MRTDKDRKNYKDWYENHKEEVRKKKREQMRRLRKLNPEKYRNTTRRCIKRLREKLFEIYGQVCCNCGFDDKRALTLDHILNNGCEERKRLGERGVYRRARENYLPEEYQILCMNCQFIKRVEAKRQNQHG